jgi:hypothetical protein
VKFCQVCGLTHFDDDPPCDAVDYRYGKILTETDGTLSYEPPGGLSECRSSNANDAEGGGRLPLTRAVPIVAHHAGCTREEARAALVKTHEGEWHHTGIFSRRTRYYSVADAVTYLRKK